MMSETTVYVCDSVWWRRIFSQTTKTKPSQEFGVQWMVLITHHPRNFWLAALLNGVGVKMKSTSLVFDKLLLGTNDWLIVLCRNVAKHLARHIMFVSSRPTYYYFSRSAFCFSDDGCSSSNNKPQIFDASSRKLMLAMISSKIKDHIGNLRCVAVQVLQ